MSKADGWGRHPGEGWGSPKGGSNGGNSPKTGLVTPYAGDGRIEDTRP